MKFTARVFAATVAASVSGLAACHASDNHSGTTVHIGIHPAPTAAAQANPAPAAQHRTIATHMAAGNWVHPQGSMHHMTARHIGHCHCKHFAGRRTRHGWQFAHAWRHHWHHGYSGYGSYGGEAYADRRDGGPPAMYHDRGYGAGGRSYDAPVIAGEPGSDQRYSVWGGYNSDNGVNNFF